VEPQVRLKQARRRLRALEGSGEQQPPRPTEERRLHELEKKLDDFRREIESLRKDLHSSGAARPEATGNASVTYQRHLSFQIPFWLQVDRLQQTRNVLLYVSRDEGKTWDTVGRTEPSTRHFSYRAPCDGWYLFLIGSEDLAGNRLPATPQLPADRLVIVDTTRPEISLHFSREGNNSVVEWRIHEDNPDLGTLRLECCIAVEWKAFTIAGALRGRAVVNAPITAARLRMKDLAGNEQVEAAGKES
jgi:hypothetical protein